MANTRSNKEQKAKKKVTEEPTIPVRETDNEVPDQSIDGAEWKTTEPTPYPNVDEQEKKNNRVLTNRQCRPNTKKDTS